MKIWICIPVFNRIEYTLKCLASLQVQSFRNFQVVVCDHGSSDGTTATIQAQFPDMVVLNADSNLWWTGAINRCLAYALEHAAADDGLLTMNNDNEVPENYLQNLAIHFSQFPNSIITSVIHDISNGKLIEPGYRQNWFHGTAYPVDHAKQHVVGYPDVIAVTHASGRGTLFPVQVFRQLGLFDEIHLPHYAADYDFTFKAARAGYPIYICRDCQVFSYIQATGIVKVLNRFSLSSFVNYFTSIRSPAYLPARWWFGWHNCPKWYFPVYFMIDLMRISGGYFKIFIKPYL